MNTRTCVICKKKLDKSRLFRFILLRQEIVIDLKHKVNLRGYYFCKDNNCEKYIENWVKKNKKIKRAV